MNRRSFIQLVGASTAAISLSAFGSESRQSQRDTRAVITSIKAEFGAGFELRRYSLDGGLHTATISHLDNRFVVTSKDLRQWTVVAGHVG